MSVVTLGLILGVLAGSSAPEDNAKRLDRFEFAETHMGSEFKLVLYTDDAAAARRASRAAFDRIAALERAFSDYNPESEVMRLCDQAGGPPVAVSADLFDILQRAKTLHERSEGAFDVTVGPAVRQWRRARRDGKMPTAENLARARSLTGSQFLHLNAADRTVRLDKPGMKIDLGGIAKGYASDAAIQVLRSQGVSRALVAGAGDVVVSEPPTDRGGWLIGVAPLENPESAPELYLTLKNSAVSTSGDAERFVVIDGKRYSHIVDPRTAIGVIDRTSVTVVSPDGATSDALATAVYVLGPEKGLRLIEETPGASALIVRKEGERVVTHESRGFRELPRSTRPDAPPAARLSPR